MKKFTFLSATILLSIQLFAQHRVGINTRTPAYALDVYDSANQGFMANFSSNNADNSFIQVNSNAVSAATGTAMYRKGSGTAYTYIDSAGDYIQNTANGEVMLSVNGEVGIGTDSYDGTQLGIYDEDNSGFPFYMESANTNNSMLGIDADNNTAKVGISVYRSGANVGQFYLNSQNDFQLNVGPYGSAYTTLYAKSSNGFVGVGTTNPGVELDVNGAVRGTSVYQVSDIRLKKDILPIENDANDLFKLQAVQYNWKQDNAFNKKFDNADKTQFGFIAQEVEKVYPNLVATDAQGLKSVEYTQIIPLLVEALKEQQKEIDELREQQKEMDALKEQQKEIQTLKEEIQKLLKQQ
jgi:hypothetical protein